MPNTVILKRENFEKKKKKKYFLYKLHMFIIKTESTEEKQNYLNSIKVLDYLFADFFLCMYCYIISVF